MSKERTGIITFLGNPLTLTGNPVSIGDNAPEFTVLTNDLSPVSLSNYKGKILIISVVPSLDTSVCDMQTHKFAKDVVSLGDKVHLLTISCDLPFAQARWCGSSGLDNIESLSDHKDLSFGLAYGLVIKELRLLTRAVLVINADGKIVYEEIVPEVTNEPNYSAALSAAKVAC